MEDEPQSGSRVSGAYTVFDGGYTNPSYGMSDRDETTAMPDTTATRYTYTTTPTCSLNVPCVLWLVVCRFVDYSSDGTRVTTTTNTQKELYYIPPSTSQPAQPTEPGRRASTRRETGHSEASSGVDAALAEKQKTT